MMFLSYANTFLMEVYDMLYRFPDHVFNESVNKLSEKNCAVQRKPGYSGFMYMYEFYGTSQVGYKSIKLHSSLDDEMVVIMRARQDTYDGLATCKNTLISTLNLTRGVEQLKLVLPTAIHDLIDVNSEEIIPQEGSSQFKLASDEELYAHIVRNKAGLDKMVQMFALNLLIG